MFNNDVTFLLFILFWLISNFDNQLWPSLYIETDFMCSFYSLTSVVQLYLKHRTFFLILVLEVLTNQGFLLSFVLLSLNIFN